MCNGLWKSVENFPGFAPEGAATRRPPRSAYPGEPGPLPLRLMACSACAGDYEDPDRTAWPSGAEADEDGPVEEALDRPSRIAGPVDEFPAEEA